MLNFLSRTPVYTAHRSVDSNVLSAVKMVHEIALYQYTTYRVKVLISVCKVLLFIAHIHFLLDAVFVAILKHFSAT